LKIIEKEGGFAVSQDKIQELAESAQKVGLHLKTCCTVLDGGQLNPQQFQQCVDKASGYETQMAEVARQISFAKEAKAGGDSEPPNSRIGQIGASVEAAISSVNSLEKFVQTDLEPEQAEQKPDGVSQEQEPNDQVTQANPISLGKPTQGKLSSSKDRDYFQFRTEDTDSKIRLIVRKSVTGGYYAEAIVYNHFEERIAGDHQNGDDAVTFSFNTKPDAVYYIILKPRVGQGGSYELLVRAE
jgi:hypothetical protein